MSVAEPLRHKGRLEVHVKAQFLASYTAEILKNQKIFSPETDANLINRIRNCSLDIFIKAWQANKIRADTNKVNRMMRYELQEEAILLCDELHACIGVAKKVYHLRHKRRKYWSGLSMEVRKLLQAWKESDVSRYGQP